MLNFEKLTTIREYCKKNSWPTEKSWRWMLFNMKTNGMHNVFIRIPGQRQVLIDLTEFEKFIETGRGKATEHTNHNWKSKTDHQKAEEFAEKHNAK